MSLPLYGRVKSPKYTQGMPKCHQCRRNSVFHCPDCGVGVCQDHECNCENEVVDSEDEPGSYFDSYKDEEE